MKTTVKTSIVLKHRTQAQLDIIDAISSVIESMSDEKKSYVSHVELDDVSTVVTFSQNAPLQRIAQVSVYICEVSQEFGVWLTIDDDPPPLSGHQIAFVVTDTCEVGTHISELKA